MKNPLPAMCFQNGGQLRTSVRLPKKRPLRAISITGNSCGSQINVIYMFTTKGMSSSKSSQIF